MRAAKRRVTITVSADLLRKVDATAKAAGRTRSSVIDGWLRNAARTEAERSLDEDIAAYYEGLSDRERAEDAEWARLSTRSFEHRETGVARTRRKGGSR